MGHQVLTKNKINQLKRRMKWDQLLECRLLPVGTLECKLSLQCQIKRLQFRNKGVIWRHLRDKMMILHLLINLNHLWELWQDLITNLQVLGRDKLIKKDSWSRVWTLGKWTWVNWKVQVTSILSQYMKLRKRWQLFLRIS